MFNNWHKKEKPIQGLMGFGGGATGNLAGGGASSGFSGTGGSYEKTPGDGYKYHMFKNGGPTTFTVDPGFNGDTTGVEILVVAGGGGGGNRTGGGGGAGGVAFASNIPLPSSLAGNNLIITVGGGNDGPGNGQDSVFGPGQPFEIRSLGGGTGGTDGLAAGPGGSGGGGHYEYVGGNGLQPQQNPGKPWVTNYGNNGNSGYAPHPWESGAGGGAGSGATAGGPGYRGQAGSGVSIPTFPSPKFCPPGDPWHAALSGRGSNQALYGGGGGAGSYPPYSPSLNMPSGAIDGGGGYAPNGSNGGDGINGTGGGGGGATNGPDSPNAGKGGDGVVVIRYPI